MKQLATLLGLSMALACTPGIDFSQGAPFECSYGGDPTQCPNGWHCGKSGVCFDPSAGAALPCTYDGGLPDCPNDWICGRDGVCHSESAAAAYDCVNDSDCVGGWRCNLVHGVCADVPDELVPDSAALGALAANRSNPLLLRGAPSAVAGIDGTGYCALVCRTSPAGLSFVTDAGLTWTAFGDGFGAPQVADSQTTPWSKRILALSQLPSQTAVLDDAGLWSVTNEDGALPSQIFASNGETQLRSTIALAGSGFSLHLVFPTVAFSSRELSVVDLSGNWSPFLALPLPGADGGAQHIRDVTFGSWTLTNTTWLFAAGDEGVFAASLPNPDGGPPAWSPVDLGFESDWYNSECGDSAPDVRRLEVFDPIYPLVYDPDDTGTFLAEQIETDAGLVWRYLPDIRATPSTEASCGNMPVPAGVYGELGGAALSICPPGFTVSHFGSAAAFGNLTFDGGILAMCVPPEGPGEVRATQPPDEGTFLPSWEVANEPSTLYSDIGVTQADRGGLVAVAGVHGQLWVGASGSMGVLPVFADRESSTVGTIVGGGSAVANVTGIYMQTAYGLEPYLPAGPPPGQPEGFVTGAPTWMLVAEGPGPTFNSVAIDELDSNNVSQVANIDGRVTPLAAPFHAQRLTLADGGGELVVSALSSIFSSPVTPDAELQLHAGLPFQLPIMSMALSAADGGALLNGYALSSQGLFQIAATDEETWALNEIVLPSGHWVKVWNDGDRGRLGGEDGTVLGLPSPVRLADALPSNPMCPGETAIDFADVCGQAFMLTSCDLYRLVPDGGSGSWVEESSPWPEGFADRDLTGGALATLGSTLRVSSHFGESVVLSIDGGCP